MDFLTRFPKYYHEPCPTRILIQTTGYMTDLEVRSYCKIKCESFIPQCIHPCLSLVFCNNWKMETLAETVHVIEPFWVGNCYFCFEEHYFPCHPPFYCNQTGGNWLEIIGLYIFLLVSPIKFWCHVLTLFYTIHLSLY